MNEPTYGLIGRGRVARHLSHYLELEGQRVTTWHRGLRIQPRPRLEGCGAVLLAISDDALQPFVNENPWLADRTVVHFSGSRTVAGACGLHPLMTFGPELYDLESYRAIPFIEEEGGRRFHDVFPALCNRSWSLDPDLKPLYHALCVLAGNFTTMLWSKAFSDFERRLGLPREALLPYLRQTCRNTVSSGPVAFTGSLARGDHGTTARDLEALADDPYGQVFEAFVAAFEIAEETA